MTRTPKCDEYGHRIRASHHEIHLEDFMTGQELGRYHLGCRDAVAKYLVGGGTVMRASICQPPRCGQPPEFADCDAGFFRGGGLMPTKHTL